MRTFSVAALLVLLQSMPLQAQRLETARAKVYLEIAKVFLRETGFEDIHRHDPYFDGYDDFPSLNSRQAYLDGEDNFIIGLVRRTRNPSLQARTKASKPKNQGFGFNFRPPIRVMPPTNHKIWDRPAARPPHKHTHHESKANKAAQDAKRLRNAGSEPPNTSDSSKGKTF